MTKFELDNVADIIFKDRGGILNIDVNQNNAPSRYMKEANSILNYLKIHYPNLPQIHICFLDNSQVNACALKHENIYFIAVNIGTCILLDNIFFSYFSCTHLLKQIGNASNESEETANIDAIFKNEILEYDRLLGKPITHPKDKTRFGHAILYSNFAFDYLILHECCHIIRGHIDLMQNILGNNSFHWNEAQSLDKEINEEQIPLISQTLEMDADSFATNHAINNGIVNIKNKNQPTDAHRNIFQSLNSFLENWGFAIYTLFRIFDFKKINLDNIKYYLHPPPAARLDMIHSNVATLLLETYKMENANSLITTLLNSAFNAETIFSETTKSKPSILQFIEASQDEKVSKYILEINTNWNKTRPLLIPFTYGELPGEFKLE